MFGGENDTRYTGDQLQAWKDLCSSDASSSQWGGVHWFSGSHHFYTESRDLVVQFIIDDLNQHYLNTNTNNNIGEDWTADVVGGGFGSPISSSTLVVETNVIEIESVYKDMASPSPFEMSRDDDDDEGASGRGRGSVKASASVPEPKSGCIYLRRRRGRRWCF